MSTLKPTIFEHKETKKRFRAMPWWERLAPIVASNEDLGALKIDLPDEKREYKIGALVQIGWLLENEHGVWFGVGPGITDFFDEVDQQSGIPNRSNPSDATSTENAAGAPPAET